ncbi:hypothetical protein SRHO_G00106560 [Serrasalmus rhombeus]
MLLSNHEALHSVIQRPDQPAISYNKPIISVISGPARTLSGDSLRKRDLRCNGTSVRTEGSGQKRQLLSEKMHNTFSLRVSHGALNVLKAKSSLRYSVIINQIKHAVAALKCQCNPCDGMCVRSPQLPIHATLMPAFSSCTISHQRQRG